MKKKFKDLKMNSENSKWSKSISRQYKIYEKPNEMRTEFERDYTRILHSRAYRRLKHKTQVFYAPSNDHICTRMEHVNHVTSISYTISKFLGLNTELTNAIAIGHDLGHAPFGHRGEEILTRLVKKEINKDFWHEKNSLRFIDKIETLITPKDNSENLNLTYAVRDGILLHCGELDESYLFPRKNYINLENITTKGKYQPYTWEGCVVKISDKIAYIGRDIEDALRLDILTPKDKTQLENICSSILKIKKPKINNSLLIHEFISDLCKNSNAKNGIRLSKNYFNLMKKFKTFNAKKIYNHKKLLISGQYAELVITSIYYTLKDWSENLNNITFKPNYLSKNVPDLFTEFHTWLIKYSNLNKKLRNSKKYNNSIIYDLNKKNDIIIAIIDFIAGMTDNYANIVFNELIKF